MRHLLDSLQASLALSPVGIAVQLPGGQRLGDANAELRLQFRDRMGVVALAMGEIGSVGAAIGVGGLFWIVGAAVGLGSGVARRLRA